MAERLPPPPSVVDLASIQPALYTLRAGAKLARIWFADTGYPTGFALFRRYGPTGSRFDHHLCDPEGLATQSPDRGIIYAVPQVPTAFMTAIGEVFQTSRTVNRTQGAPTLSIFHVTRDVALLDVSGHFATKVGGSASLSSGPRNIARDWSKAFYAAYPQIEGIRYRSSMSGGSDISLALYERCEDAMPHSPNLSLSLNHPEITRAVLDAAESLGYQIED